MIKKIGEKLWYCCPNCGQKLFPVSPDARCQGLYFRCKQKSCGWEGEVIIKKGA